MVNWQAIFYLIPYIISFGISLGVGVYAWRRKSVRGAFSFAWVAISQACATLAYIFELVSPSLRGKIFWDDFQWLGLTGWFFGILAFVIQFTETKLTHPKRTWTLLSIIPGALFLGILTNGYHGLIHTNETILPGEPFSALDYEITAAPLFFAVYGYIFILTSLFFLIRNYNKAQQIYRSQAAIIFLGTVVPLVGTMLTAVGVNLAFHRDYTPFTFAVGNLVIVYGIFRYHLLDIVPVAYRVVFENISDAVVVLDNQGRLVNSNPAAKLLIPNLSESLIGKNAVDIFTGREDLVVEFHQGEEIQTELDLSTNDGSYFQDLRISPLHNRRGDLIGRVIVARDITKIKLTEKAASNYASELESTNRELEAFSYSVSHDLRAPLRAVQGFAEILSDEYSKQLDSQGQDYLTRILTNSAQMELLIENMLKLSRVTSLEMKREKVNLSEIAENISTELIASQPERDVKFDITPEVFSEGDQGLIQVVLENLLGNAWKFSSKQQEATIVFGTQEDGEQRIFFVRDNGVGFDMRFREKIFDPFQRLHALSEFPGSGIGLATVQRIIRKHGGQVWAEGEVDHGATFYFTLPV